MRRLRGKKGPVGACLPKSRAVEHLPGKLKAPGLSPLHSKPTNQSPPPPIYQFLMPLATYPTQAASTCSAGAFCTRPCWPQ